MGCEEDFEWDVYSKDEQEGMLCLKVMEKESSVCVVCYKAIWALDGVSDACVKEGRPCKSPLGCGVLQGWTLGGDGSGYLRGMSHGLGWTVWLAGWLAGWLGVWLGVLLAG